VRTSSRSCWRDAGASSWAPPWHTFWNATDAPARLLEIISPAGFEQLFVEVADLLRTAPEDAAAGAAISMRYGLEYDGDATAQVIAEHGLVDRIG
jgi:hypothetical protein